MQGCSSMETIFMKNRMKCDLNIKNDIMKELFLSFVLKTKECKIKRF